jgi:hypothetical protein
VVEQLDLRGDGDLVARRASLLERDRVDVERVDRPAQDRVRLVRRRHELQPAARHELLRHGLRHALLELHARGAVHERRHFDRADRRVEEVAVADERVAARRQEKESEDRQPGLHRL